MGVVDRVECDERFGEVVTGDLILDDVDLLKDRLVELAALLVVGLPVELLGVGEQSQAVVDEPGSGVQVGR